MLPPVSGFSGLGEVMAFDITNTAGVGVTTAGVRVDVADGACIVRVKVGVMVRVELGVTVRVYEEVAVTDGVFVAEFATLTVEVTVAVSTGVAVDVSCGVIEGVAVRVSSRVSVTV